MTRASVHRVLATPAELVVGVDVLVAHTELNGREKGEKRNTGFSQFYYPLGGSNLSALQSQRTKLMV
jgi:hypothetical protein